MPDPITHILKVPVTHRLTDFSRCERLKRASLSPTEYFWDRRDSCICHPYTVKHNSTGSCTYLISHQSSYCLLSPHLDICTSRSSQSKLPSARARADHDSKAMHKPPRPEIVLSKDKTSTAGCSQVCSSTPGREFVLFTIDNDCGLFADQTSHNWWT